MGVPGAGWGGQGPQGISVPPLAAVAAFPLAFTCGQRLTPGGSAQNAGFHLFALILGRLHQEQGPELSTKKAKGPNPPPPAPNPPQAAPLWADELLPVPVPCLSFPSLPYSGMGTPHYFGGGGAKATPTQPGSPGAPAGRIRPRLNPAQGKLRHGLRGCWGVGTSGMGQKKLLHP